MFHMEKLLTVTIIWLFWKSSRITSGPNDRACGLVELTGKPTVTSSFITTMPHHMCLPKLWDSSRTSDSCPTRSTPWIWHHVTSFCFLIWSQNCMVDSSQPLKHWRWKSSGSSEWWKAQKLNCSTIQSGIWLSSGRSVWQQKDIILKAARSTLTRFQRQRHQDSQPLTCHLNLSATIERDAHRPAVFHMSFSCSWTVHRRINIAAKCGQMFSLSFLKKSLKVWKISVSKSQI